MYKVLERLGDAGYLEARWEDLAPDKSRPRRRLYHLTRAGADWAAAVLEERLPATSAADPNTDGIRPEAPAAELRRRIHKVDLGMSAPSQLIAAQVLHTIDDILVRRRRDLAAKPRSRGSS